MSLKAKAKAMKSPLVVKGIKKVMDTVSKGEVKGGRIRMKPKKTYGKKAKTKRGY